MKKPNKQKNAKDAEPSSKEPQNTAPTAKENSTGQKDLTNEAADILPSGIVSTPFKPPNGGPPPPPAEQTRVQAVEQAITVLATKQDQIIDFLTQAGQAGTAQTQTQPSQPGQPVQIGKAQIPSELFTILAGAMREPDPYQGMVQQKVLSGLDLSNALIAAIIKRVAEGKGI